MNSEAGLGPGPVPSIRALTRVDEVESLSLSDLSDFFNPFLAQFMRDALRAGGEVLVSIEGNTVRGIFTYDDVEQVASIFSRDRLVAETLSLQRHNIGIFSDFTFGPGAEVYHIFATELSEPSVPHRFAHRVRIADVDDRGSILELMREMYGRIREGWLRSIPREEEPCFVATVGPEIAGVGWASVANGHARLHALSVRPGYRRMGIGTDLLHARLLWAREAGARHAICEISEHNIPSRAIASAGGMRPIGQILYSRRP
jgi:GNAT superfamily N-acetyltransferase